MFTNDQGATDWVARRVPFAEAAAALSSLGSGFPGWGWSTSLGGSQDGQYVDDVDLCREPGATVLRYELLGPVLHAGRRASAQRAVRPGVFAPGVEVACIVE